MILSTILKYMDTKTLERMSTINAHINNEYKKRVNSTVYLPKLINQSQPISAIESHLDQKKQMVKAYTGFNSLFNESVLILFNNQNNLLLYDLQLDQVAGKFNDIFSIPGEYVGTVHHYYNTKTKKDYVLLTSNKKTICIYSYIEGFKLEVRNRIELASNDKHLTNVSIYPFQIITADYFAVINQKLEILSFDGKQLASTSKNHSGSTNVKGFISQKDNQTYLYTYFYQGIFSFKLSRDTNIQIKTYKSYSSWNSQTTQVQYFHSQETNEDYLIEINMGSLIFWDFHTGVITYKLELSSIDSIFSLALWNSDIVYLTTYSGKLHQVSVSSHKVVQSPVVFADVSFISPVTIHQPALVSLSSDGSLQVLTYDFEA